MLPQLMVLTNNLQLRNYFSDSFHSTAFTIVRSPTNEGTVDANAYITVNNRGYYVLIYETERSKIDDLGQMVVMPNRSSA